MDAVGQPPSVQRLGALPSHHTEQHRQHIRQVTGVEDQQLGIGAHTINSYTLYVSKGKIFTSQAPYIRSVPERAFSGNEASERDGRDCFLGFQGIRGLSK